MASGRDRARELLALKPRPDAIFVANGLMACGALQALEEAGLSCPGDLALACFDRLDFFDLLRPRLTGVVVHPYKLGVHGAEFVLKRISGKATGRGRRYLLPPSSFSESPQPPSIWAKNLALNMGFTTSAS